VGAKDAAKTIIADGALQMSDGVAADCHREMLRFANPLQIQTDALERGHARASARPGRLEFRAG